MQFQSCHLLTAINLQECFVELKNSCPLNGMWLPACHRSYIYLHLILLFFLTLYSFEFVIPSIEVTCISFKKSSINTLSLIPAFDKHFGAVTSKQFLLRNASRTTIVCCWLSSNHTKKQIRIWPASTYDGY